MQKQDLVSIRTARADDVPFLFATWLRGLYYGAPLYDEIPKDTFMSHYHKVLEKLLLSASISVACLKDDPDVILGYAVYRGDILDFVFVKSAWRGIGLAHMLIPDDIRYVTHLTRTGLSIMKKHPGKFVYNPFLID
jgi:hypothetical protein